jgi:hypothetical protein
MYVETFKTDVFVFKDNVVMCSWQSVLLMEETGVLGENHQPVANH